MIEHGGKPACTTGPRSEEEAPQELIRKTRSVPDEDTTLGERHASVQVALLSVVSVIWGLGVGVLSITVGLLAGSLGVVGLGLDVLADVAGSAGLVWRFRQERSDPTSADRAEARASAVVAICSAPHCGGADGGVKPW